MARKKKTKTKKDSNVVIKEKVNVDNDCINAMEVVKNYCESTNCEECMYSQILHNDRLDTNYVFCIIKNRKPSDWEIA